MNAALEARKLSKGTPRPVYRTTLDTSGGDDGFLLPAQLIGDRPVHAWEVRLGHTMFFLVGTMGAWSYHCFLADPSFVQHLYRYAANDPNAVPAHPKLWSNVLNYVTLVRLTSNTLTQTLNLTPVCRRLSIPSRIFFGLALMVLVLATPLGVTADGHVGELAAFTLLLSAVALSGLATGFQQSTLFSFAALFPEWGFAQTALLGMGAAAAGTSVAKLVTKHSFPSTFEGSLHESRAYFGVGLGWLLVAVGSLIVFLRAAPLARLHGSGKAHMAGGVTTVRAVGASSIQVADDQDEEQGRTNIPIWGSGLRRPGQEVGYDVHTDDGSSMASVQPTLSGWGEGGGAPKSALPAKREPAVRQAEPRDADSPSSASVQLVSDCDEDTARPSSSVLYRVCRGLAPLLLCNLVIYGGSFSVYPGVLVRTDNHDEWFKIYIVLVFNATLAFGRLASRAVDRVAGAVATNPTALLLVSLLRLVGGVPLFIFYFADHPDRKTGAYVLAAVFQLVAGVLSGLVAIAVPRSSILAGDEPAKAAAGNVLSLSILLSATVGVLINLAVVHWYL